MRIFSIAKRINKKITIQKQKNDDSSSQDQASFLTESYSFDLPFFWIFTYIPRYIKYFNSFECEQLPIISSTKYEYINTPELYKETHFKYYIKKKIYNYIDSLGLKIAQSRITHLITQSQLEYLEKTTFSVLR